MTTDQLKKLKENDLRRFSYTKTMDVVETLESLNLIDISGIAAHEEIETYISLTAIIKNRVDHDELQKQPKLLNRKSKDRDKDKDILRNRLINILANLRFAYNFVRLNSRIDTVEKISDNIQGIREDFNNLQKDYEDKKKTVDNIIDKHREELNASERAIMSHVLSIMGVFSAVITLIMSVVISKSFAIDTFSAIVTAFFRLSTLCFIVIVDFSSTQLLLDETTVFSFFLLKMSNNIFTSLLLPEHHIIVQVFYIRQY